MQRLSIRTILVLLVLAVAVPFAAGLFYFAQQELAGRIDFAREMARGAAASTRSLIDLVIGETIRLAERVATRDCDTAQGLELSPFARFATVALVDRSGAVICHIGRVASAPAASIGQTPEFRRLADQRAFVMGEPANGALSGRWELLLLQPRVDARGTWLGAAAVALDLAGLEELLRYRLLDSRDSLSILTADGRFIARSRDSAQWIGRTADVHALLAGQMRLHELGASDDRERIGVAEQVPATGWLVFAGLDRTRVLADVYRQNTAIAVVFVAVVAGAVLLGLWLSLRIARPIAALAEDASAAEGVEPYHVPVCGPREVAAVAQRLNEAADARAEAEAHVRRSQRFANHFLQYSSVVYARIGAGGDYQLVNRRWRDYFGTPGQAIEGMRFGDFLPPEEAARRRELLALVVQTGKPVTRELDASTKLGKRILLSTFFPVLSEAGSVEAVGTVAIDMTELRAAERERERLTAILTRVTEAVPICLSYVDADDRYAWINSRDGDRLGLAPVWIIGKTVEEVLAAQDYAAFEPVLAALREGKRVRDEVAWRHDGGATQYYERHAVPDFDANGRYCGYTAVWLDVTASKLAAQREREDAERTRALSHRLITAQEAERRAIARELHDEVGQSLTAVQATLQSLAPLTTDLDFAARLDESAASVNRAIEEIRNASMRLRPSVLDDLGLVPALRWLVGQQSRATGLDISLKLDALSSDVPPEIATGCFRIAQEAITNAVRHASAQRVTVRVAERGEQLSVEVEDDGLGFDPAAAQAKARSGEGNGISGMRERAELLGGTAVIDAARGRGTIVRASFPLGAPVAAATHAEYVSS